MLDNFHTLTGIDGSRGIKFEPAIRIPDRFIESQEGVILKGLCVYNLGHTRSETTCRSIHSKLLIIVHENDGTRK